MDSRAIERFNLAERVAWVPGGAGLLGVAVCRALAQHGAHVIISDVKADDASKLAANIRAEGLLADAISLDASSEESIMRCAAEIINRYHRLDCCVNMTWRYKNTRWEQMTSAEWYAGIDVTLTGAFFIAREAGKIMQQQKRGSIVQFSSMYGVVSPDPGMYPDNLNPNPIDYGVAKAGVLQMVRYQGVALAQHGVRVNAIVPGPFPYPWSQQQDEAFMSRLKLKVPMGRVGNAEEIAGAVVFLCSDASSFVTATQIVVDGGWTAW